MSLPKLNAEVISVLPNKIKVLVRNIEEFKDKKKLSVGSYLKITDEDEYSVISVIESYNIQIEEDEKDDGNREKRYIIEALPVGYINKEGNFIRGTAEIAIPPKKAEPATHEDIEKMYKSSTNSNFEFSTLVLDQNIRVPVDGNRFFSKHIAIVGSTGSGKSHTIAKILQEATSTKNQGVTGLNNSHIVLFDIHSEYHSAFPNAKVLTVDNLKLPYWLLNSEELEELFLDTEANDHNQRNVFKEAVTADKVVKNPDLKKIHYDSPVKFDIKEVYNFIKNKNEEMVPSSRGGDKQGALYGKLTNFISRLENKINDQRLDFLLSQECMDMTFDEVLKVFIGYTDGETTNTTIIDLSGVPFDVLSITVSLISRILFEYGYHYKKTQPNIDTPLLLVYEEAHKYVPKSDLSKYRASRESIERIAKEGRKYGVGLAIVSQRPSEISETIFSQCNNFISMRLTNPEDQNYVKRLLPDTLGNLTDALPILQAGEALLIGDSVPIPSIVKIDRCNDGCEPSSNDIKYIEEWKKDWFDSVDFNGIIKRWQGERNK